MSIFSACNDVANTNGILESTIDMCNSIESLEEGVFKYSFYDSCSSKKHS